MTAASGPDAVAWAIVCEHEEHIADLIAWREALQAAIAIALAAAEKRGAERGAPKAREIDDLIREVAELPDRTSPDDQPDMMMVTADELRPLLASALAAAEKRGEEREREACANKVWGLRPIEMEHSSAEMRCWYEARTNALKEATAAIRARSQPDERGW